jgi:hypothetical protein
VLADDVFERYVARHLVTILLRLGKQALVALVIKVHERLCRCDHDLGLESTREGDRRISTTRCAECYDAFVSLVPYNERRDITEERKGEKKNWTLEGMREKEEQNIGKITMID